MSARNDIRFIAIPIVNIIVILFAIGLYLSGAGVEDYHYVRSIDRSKRDVNAEHENDYISIDNNNNNGIIERTDDDDYLNPNNTNDFPIVLNNVDVKKPMKKHFQHNLVPLSKQQHRFSSRKFHNKTSIAAGFHRYQFSKNQRVGGNQIPIRIKKRNPNSSKTTLIPNPSAAPNLIKGTETESKKNQSNERRAQQYGRRGKNRMTISLDYNTFEHVQAYEKSRKRTRRQASTSPPEPGTTTTTMTTEEGVPKELLSTITSEHGVADDCDQPYEEYIVMELWFTKYKRKFLPFTDWYCYQAGIHVIALIIVLCLMVACIGLQTGIILTSFTIHDKLLRRNMFLIIYLLGSALAGTAGGIAIGFGHLGSGHGLNYHYQELQVMAWWAAGGLMVLTAILNAFMIVIVIRSPQEAVNRIRKRGNNDADKQKEEGAAAGF